MRHSFPLGRVFGVPVGLNPSWFIAFGLLTGILALRVYPLAIPARDADLYWAMALVSGVLFFFSILLHELAHSVVARAFGIPVKGITLFILGGVSQITREAPRARQELLMAFAGPATSFVLAGLALAAWFLAGAGGRPVAVILEWLWVMNFGVGLFNMVPGFPLDGGRVLRAAIWGISGSYAGATRWAAYAGRGIAWVIITYGALSVLLGDRIGWGTDILGGFWLIFIGGFLDMAARGSWLRTRSLMALRTVPVADVVETGWPLLAPFARLEDAEAQGMVATEDDHLLVVDDGRIIGVVAGDRALQALDEDSMATAIQVMFPAASFEPIKAGDTAMEAWERMEERGVPVLPVLDEGRFAGLVRRGRLLQLLRRNGQPAG
jgi:Zn-dependent protease